MDNDFLVSLCNFLDNVGEWLGKIFSWLVVLLTIVVVIDFLARLLQMPTSWGFESGKFIFGAHFMLVASYGLLYGSHVRIDLVTSLMPRMIESIVSLICYICLFFPFVGVWLYYGSTFFYSSWAMAEKSWSSWGVPLYPIKLVIPLAAFFLILQGISEVVKTIVTIRILVISSREVAK
jgi:TRAP-type mannitol/chloroaromatic compound transport system permease small subunit